MELRPWHDWIMEKTALGIFAELSESSSRTLYIDPIQKAFFTTEHTEYTENLKVMALTDKPASENFAWDLSIVENRWRNLLSSISFSQSTG